jgi:hypothetical protein
VFRLRQPACGFFVADVRSAAELEKIRPVLIEGADAMDRIFPAADPQA